MFFLFCILLFVRNSVSKLLDEIELHYTQSNTYKLASRMKEDVIDDNITLSSKSDLDVQSDVKDTVHNLLAL